MTTTLLWPVTLRPCFGSWWAPLVCSLTVIDSVPDERSLTLIYFDFRTSHWIKLRVKMSTHYLSITICLTWRAAFVLHLVLQLLIFTRAEWVKEWINKWISCMSSFFFCSSLTSWYVSHITLCWMRFDWLLGGKWRALETSCLSC